MKNLLCTVHIYDFLTPSLSSFIVKRGKDAIFAYVLQEWSPIAGMKFDKKGNVIRGRSYWTLC